MVSETVFKKAPYANVKLKKLDADLTHTSTTEWTLTKVGSLGGATVTWQATATQGATQSGILIVNGLFRVENKGKAGATIGNIVVNLQTRNHKGKWVTRSSNIADATEDDDATEAHIDEDASSEHKSFFKENTASGSLLFTDATTNSTFALVPQVTIAPGAKHKLRFTSSYDNNVLNLPIGTRVRAEVIVSFGNARPHHDSERNVDINGNGIIDEDEHWIRSVSGREHMKVPAQTPSNQEVTLIDRVEDITTTGTVTFTNPMITINFPNAFVTVNYNGGASGGTITNCAHLVSDGQLTTVDGDDFQNVNPIDLTACDTQVIGPHQCNPGEPGCGWEDGDMVTYNQDNWGGDPGTSTAAALLANHFGTVYPGDAVEVGLSGSAGFSIIFTSAAAIFTYQPSSGGPGPLNADLIDPTSTSSGTFGGHVLALQLDVDFTDANLVSGTTTLKFGDLILCGLTDTPLYNGLTVRQLLATMNAALAASSAAYTFETLDLLTSQVTNAFESGSVSLFAQDHLFSTATCP